MYQGNYVELRILFEWIEDHNNRVRMFPGGQPTGCTVSGKPDNKT